MGVNDRIRQFREAKTRNPTQFAADIGVPRTTLLGWESGKTVPIETLEKIRLAYPDLSVDWLLSGRGEMCNSSTFGGEGGKSETVSVPLEGTRAELLLPMRQPDPSHMLASQSADIDPAMLALAKRWGYPEDVTVYKYRKGHAEAIPISGPDPEGTVFIPVFSQTVAAGAGQEATQLVETEEMAPVLYALCQGHKPERCGVCRVVGDSMTDVTLFNGDYVVFDRLDIRGDGIFVIGMYGEMRVKRLQYRLADRKIVIASENARRYPDPEIVSAEVIERGELNIYGRVLGWLHRHPY
jgi:SOS-response transcriptional repressor LexA/DNA-binding XRE family transcriptional regulator